MTASLPTTTEGMNVISRRATVVYPNILDNGAPRVQESRRFIYKDILSGKLYTDTGYTLFPVTLDPTSGYYICQARRASL